MSIAASFCAFILLATGFANSASAQSFQANQSVHYSEISPLVVPSTIQQQKYSQAPQNLQPVRSQQYVPGAHQNQAFASADSKSSSAFKLNAQVTDSPQLSRDAGDLMLSHLSPVAQPPNLSPPAVPVSPATLKQLMPQSSAMPSATFTARPPLKGGASVQQAPPPSYLTEYNVDWSTWISQMAARWHKNLRFLEESSNVGFHTVRPALIEFTCSNNGMVGNISLKQSSGVYAYDQLQMLALSQVTPLPPFPRGTKCATITLLQGWESHAKKPGDTGFDPNAFGKGFPMEKVKQWVRANY